MHVINVMHVCRRWTRWTVQHATHLTARPARGGAQRLLQSLLLSSCIKERTVCHRLADGCMQPEGKTKATVIAAPSASCHAWVPLTLGRTLQPRTCHKFPQARESCSFRMSILEHLGFMHMIVGPMINTDSDANTPPPKLTLRVNGLRPTCHEMDHHSTYTGVAECRSGNMHDSRRPAGEHRYPCRMCCKGAHLQGSEPEESSQVVS